MLRSVKVLQSEIALEIHHLARAVLVLLYSGLIFSCAVSVDSFMSLRCFSRSSSHVQRDRVPD